jgi:hypothetical protein
MAGEQHDTARLPWLTCSYEDDQWPARLTVTGDVDLVTVNQFAVALSRAIAREPGLLVDLRHLTFIGAVGVRELCVHRSGIAGILVDQFMFRLLTVTGIARANDLPIMTGDMAAS